MKKQLTAIALTILIVLSSGITTLAAPELINAGGEWISFDSEYYAANNPDVVAAVGTDTKALLQHYISSGQYEGRLCCAPLTQVGTAKILSGDLYYSNDIVISAMPGTRLQKIVAYRASGTVSSSSEIVYDSKGNLIRLRDQQRDYIYEYDNHGNLISKTWGGNLKTTYDSHGNEIKLEDFYLGRVIVTDYVYDNAGKLAELVRYEGKDGKDIYRMKYSYDKEGKLVSTVGGYDNKKTDFAEVRRYNDMGKMIYKGQGVGLEALPFPGFDQEVQAAIYYEYAYDELGRLIQNGGITYEYDSRGNVTRRISADESRNAVNQIEFIYE